MGPRGFLVDMQDAVRCIVSMVTDDSGEGEEGAESLFNDLVRHGDDPAVCDDSAIFPQFYHRSETSIISASDESVQVFYPHIPLCSVSNWSFLQPCTCSKHLSPKL